jgi:hypothetical protein
MAVEVKAGETYTAANTKNGDGWSLFKVKAEKGQKELAVFTDGLRELNDGDQITVTKITSVRLSARKGRDDKWYDTMSVNAEVSVNGSAPSAFQEVEDGDLPF